MNRRLLAIYLNDHLAGATIGVELVRRTSRQNTGTPLGVFLAGTLAPEIVEDRTTLERVMAALGIRQSRPKVLAAWAVEKVGRLKLNGELVRYSPLSRLLELDGLAAGIDAKRALWLVLAGGVGDDVKDEFDFDRLAERAQVQRARLEEHRLAAAAAALA